MKKYFANQFITLIIAGSFLIFAGCSGGGGGSPTSPTVTSTGTTTVSGTVTSLQTASLKKDFFGVLYANLKSLFTPEEAIAATISGGVNGIPGVVVTIVGTGLSAVTDQNGYFEIKNVPAGNHVLSFQQGNVTAQLSITGLGQNQTVNLGNINIIGSVATNNPSPSGSSGGSSGSSSGGSSNNNGNSNNNSNGNNNGNSNNNSNGNSNNNSNGNSNNNSNGNSNRGNSNDGNSDGRSNDGDSGR